MDKNQITGLVLIFAVITGYYVFFAPDPSTLSPTAAPADSTVAAATTLAPTRTGAGIRPQAQLSTLSNQAFTLTFSNVGARPVHVVLKDYKSHDGKELNLVDSLKTTWELQLGTAKLGDLTFQLAKESDQEVVYRSTLPGGQPVEVAYSLKGTDSYVLNQVVRSPQPAPLSLMLSDDLRQFEKEINQNRHNSTVNLYTTAGDLENLGERNTGLEKKDLSQTVAWLTMKSQFFCWGPLPAVPFSQASAASQTNEAETNSVKRLQAQATLPATAFQNGAAEVDWYFGPNKFHLLKEVAPGFEENVYMGYPVINLINRGITVNVFHYLETVVSNYGLIIVLLVLLLRVVLFPLAYTSYRSMAKMRVLKPELDAIKEKHGEDAAAMQQEQLKLYQQVGVNPVSGCIPLLLQMPILLAMFNFFPNSIELRGESLFWATDLSTYDSIFDLPFSIPGYGAHVSLFTILMTASTLLVTWYNNQNTTVTGPMAQLSYIMPLVFMFVLNSYPAGLNFYYLVSNLTSFGQQLLIRATINDDAIRSKLVQKKESNAGKPSKGFAARLEQAMKLAEEQRKAQEQQKRKK